MHSSLWMKQIYAKHDILVTCD
uniref:Uncharacterized protein n=1 Tax=Arundo donax TaxID=35708 RepID=A0A0A8ZJP2_ARUDO